MTPCCMVIAKAAADRQYETRASRARALAAWRQIEPAQQFEVSGAMDAARELGAMFCDQGDWPMESTFLPSRLTLIDGFYRRGDGLVLLRENEDGTISFRDIWVEWTDNCEPRSSHGWHDIYSIKPSEVADNNGSRRASVLVGASSPCGIDGWTLRGLLCLINKERQIGGQSFRPHAGVVRALKRSRALSGQFPLRAWTKIQVRVGIDPKVNQPTSVSSARRDSCYHWVKAHKSRRHGKWTKISECWRGNPALGIKRSSRELFT